MSSEVPAAAPHGASRQSSPSPVPEEVRPPELVAIRARGARAWRPFLAEFSPFILRCIRRVARDYDERMEIYVHVCQRLHEDDCRRLKQFRGDAASRPCKFSTWLAAVVFNIAREWVRSTKGRRRLFQAVRELPRADRLIFRYYFWDGYGVAEIANLLGARHGVDGGRQRVFQGLERLERRLSRDGRWRLVTRLLRAEPPLRLEASRRPGGAGPPLQVADPSPDQESRSGAREAVSVLRQLLEELPEVERLALELKFARGMTAHAVARALGIRNYKKVYAIQGRALQRLERGMRRKGLRLADFDPVPREMDILG